MRVGIGYDVHRLADNRPLIVGGVEIPFDKGLQGHSDADVLVHAVMDALLGALGKGDIGQHFPDSDDKYKGISSMDLLSVVEGIIAADGFMVGNIDGIIIAERPKMAPYLKEMEENIAKILKADPSAVNIKATTTEGLGFVGVGQGIAAKAVATLEVRS
ncbi:MAG TPA: 2-C-methyl-D-erythritol 2,4-cyclodiphosphate synthase [Clostridia bacterium]|nr:2-C-methyl-D-erythritol 2,4-cyclodiphosphate synthase [Clostridia bacterium]